jgi:beta-glucanase (GH16 family)
MLRVVCLVAGSVAAGTLCHSAASAAASPARPVPPASGIPTGYKVVWSDEFSTPGLPDATKWTDQTFGNQQLWWHNERQYYTNKRLENAVVYDGKLLITARNETMTGAPGWVGQEFTSAKLVTADTKTWTYGFFDIRAKLPCGRGLWPALWLMSAKGSWPQDGEIDFMEAVGFEKPPLVHATLHNALEGKVPSASHGMTVADACTAFHNYQLDWRADSMTMLVDGHPFFHEERNLSGYDRWPYNHPFYLAMNVTVGGAWGGLKGIDPSVLPQTMEIDYVRVYQLSK